MPTTPVSYTHLDVYKRQDLHSVPSLTKPLLAPKPDTKIEDNLIAWLAFNIKFREDVYKRQV